MYIYETQEYNELINKLGFKELNPHNFSNKIKDRFYVDTYSTQYATCHILQCGKNKFLLVSKVDDYDAVYVSDDLNKITNFYKIDCYDDLVILSHKAADFNRLNAEFILYEDCKYRADEKIESISREFDDLSDEFIDYINYLNDNNKNIINSAIVSNCVSAMYDKQSSIKELKSDHMNILKWYN